MGLHLRRRLHSPFPEVSQTILGLSALLLALHSQGSLGSDPHNLKIKPSAPPTPWEGPAGGFAFSFWPGCDDSQKHSP